MRRGFASLLIGLAAMIAPAGSALAAEESRAAPSAAAQSPQPPLGLAEALHTIELRFPNQGGVSMVQAETYLYYMEIKSHVSRPSEGVWIPYTDEMEEIVLERFPAPVEHPISWTTSGSRSRTTRSRTVLRACASSSTWRSGSASKSSATLGRRRSIEAKSKRNCRGRACEIRLDTFIDLRMVSRIEAALRLLFADEGLPVCRGNT